MEDFPDHSKILRGETWWKATQMSVSVLVVHGSVSVSQRQNCDLFYSSFAFKSSLSLGVSPDTRKRAKNQTNKHIPELIGGFNHFFIFHPWMIDQFDGFSTNHHKTHNILSIKPTKKEVIKYIVMRGVKRLAQLTLEAREQTAAARRHLCCETSDWLSP